MQRTRKVLMRAWQKLLRVNLGAPLGSAARVNGTSTADSMEEVKAISYEDMRKLVAGGQARIFDVRSPREVANGRIANAINIPVAEVEEVFKMDPETFKRKYGVEKPRLDERNLVFYCQIGKRGARATEIATTLGYAGARNYAGGYREWSEKEGE